MILPVVLSRPKTAGWSVSGMPVPENMRCFLRSHQAREPHLFLVLSRGDLIQSTSRRCIRIPDVASCTQHIRTHTVHTYTDCTKKNKNYVVAGTYIIDMLKSLTCLKKIKPIDAATKRVATRIVPSTPNIEDGFLQAQPALCSPLKVVGDVETRRVFFILLLTKNIA